MRHFFLYIDDSSDNYLDELQPFVVHGQVTAREAESRNQEDVVNHFLSTVSRSFEWIAFIDVDELYYAPDGRFPPLVLESFAVYAGVFVVWKLSGSGGRKTETDLGVIEDPPFCLNTPSDATEMASQMSAWAAIAEGKLLTGRPIQGKTIANVRKVQEIEIDFPARVTGQLVDSRGRLFRGSWG